MTTTRWHILGIGSIGSLFARRFAAAGLAPVLLRRDTPVTGTAPAALLVTTKATDSETALAPWLAGDGSGQLVLLLQNGMGVAERLRQRWPQLRIWQAVTTAGAWRDESGELHVVSDGETRAGRFDDAGDATLDAHVAALCAAQLLLPATDIRTVLWQKLAVNALINPLTALHGCRNGELATLPATRALLAPLAREVDAVAQAEGIRLDTLALATAVMQQTAGNYSSMNRDFFHHRRSELDVITGYLLERAGHHGIAAPLNRQLYTALKAREPG